MKKMNSAVYLWNSCIEERNALYGAAIQADVARLLSCDNSPIFGGERKEAGKFLREWAEALEGE